MERRDFLVAATAMGAAATTLAAGAPSPAPTSTTAPAAASSAAMQQLLSSLARVQDEFLNADYRITSPGDIAEGHRLVLHVLNAAINFWLEADPERPVFTAYVAPARKLLGDNPDSLYYFAPIRGDRSYRIRGNLSGATFTSFTVEGGGGDGSAAARSTGALDDTAIETDAEGNYEIIASAQRPARGNWLRLDAGSGQITTRHYYESRNCIVNQSGVPVALSIEPLDPPPLPPAPGDAGIASRIATIERFVRAMLGLTFGSATGAQPRPAWFSTVPNIFNAPGQWLSETGYGNLHAHYCAAPFALAPDQALLIEGNLPQCRFANVVLWNRYMQTFDSARRQVSLNRSQMHFLADGRFRIVIAHRDPGVPGWLDTEGRSGGLVYWRYLLARGDVPTPQARVVPFDRIAAEYGDSSST